MVCCLLMSKTVWQKSNRVGWTESLECITQKMAKNPLQDWWYSVTMQWLEWESYETKQIWRYVTWAGERAQLLRPFASLSEDYNSVPSTNGRHLHNHLWLQVRIWLLVCLHAQADTHTRKDMIKWFFKVTFVLTQVRVMNSVWFAQTKWEEQ